MTTLIEHPGVDGKLTAIWFLWLPLLTLLTVLVIIDFISRRRRRQEGRPVNSDERIWRAIRQTRRDVRAYDRIGGTGYGTGVDWMDHQDRRWLRERSEAEGRD